MAALHPKALLSAVLVAQHLVGTAALAALPDPTRPPPGWTVTPPAPLPRPPVPVSLDGPATPDRIPAAPPAPPPPPPPRLQALLRPSEGQPGLPTALIDGRLVRTGDRVGETTVQEIRPDGVWLRLPRGGTQWLGLFASGQNAPRKEP